MKIISRFCPLHTRCRQSLLLLRKPSWLKSLFQVHRCVCWLCQARWMMDYWACYVCPSILERMLPTLLRLVVELHVLPSHRCEQVALGCWLRLLMTSLPYMISVLSLCELWISYRMLMWCLLAVRLLVSRCCDEIVQVSWFMYRVLQQFIDSVGFKNGWSWKFNYMNVNPRQCRPLHMFLLILSFCGDFPIFLPSSSTSNLF